MPKRKLSELDGPARPTGSKSPQISMQATRLTHKFDHGVQLISRALKTARGFERQKLGRREKTAKAQGDSATLTRLGEEIGALKVSSTLLLYRAPSAIMPDKNFFPIL